MRSPLKLQFKVGQCVSSVLDDVNKRTDAEVAAWLAAALRNARDSERDARKRQCADS